MAKLCVQKCMLERWKCTVDKDAVWPTIQFASLESWTVSKLQSSQAVILMGCEANDMSVLLIALSTTTASSPQQRESRPYRPTIARADCCHSETVRSELAASIWRDRQQGTGSLARPRSCPGEVWAPKLA